MWRNQESGLCAYQIARSQECQLGFGICQVTASCTTPLSGLAEMVLFSSSAASSSGVSDAAEEFDAGLTCDGSSSVSNRDSDAAMHSVRHLMHPSSLHVNSSGCERTLEHSAHFSFSKINRLFTLAKGD
eukprot:Em0006g1349a